MNTHFSGARWRSIATMLAGAIFFAGCGPFSQSGFLNRFDSDIRKASAAIESAKTDAQRAAAYADRGDAYGEKGRYSRVQKLITVEEYNKLFELSMADFSKAIALDSGNTDLYYRRGKVYYGRAGVEMIYDHTPSPALTPARADFAMVVARNPKNIESLDMLGLTDASMGHWTDAISDFSQESALDPKTRYRLADAYCNRGSVYWGEKKFDLAIADLTQSIEIGINSDPCECEPYNPLLAIYTTQLHDNDKAKAVLARAKANGKWISPEYLEMLKGK